MLSPSITTPNMSAINQTLEEPLKAGTFNTAKVRKRLNPQKKWDTHQDGLENIGSSIIGQATMVMIPQEKLQIL